MKKIFYILIGMIAMAGIVYATDLLTDAKSISYESEYTDKTNVADAISELLEGGGEYSEYSLLYSSNKTMSSLQTIKYKLNSDEYKQLFVKFTHSSASAQITDISVTNDMTSKYVKIEQGKSIIYYFVKAIPNMTITAKNLVTKDNNSVSLYVYGLK